MKKSHLLGAVFTCALAVVLFASFNANAALINLAKNNATTTIDTSTGGATDWYVDGTNQLFDQLYYYRVGSAGGESLLGTLTLDSFQTAFGRILELNYSGAGFTIDMTYSLSGGTNGSGVSDMAQDITIINTSGSALDFHFFQYNDFDLFGAGSDTVEQVNANTIRQNEGTSILEETVGTPAPDLYQVGAYPTILDLLNDGLATTLTNDGGPFTGDATWAWQWDFTIASGDSVIISKDLRLEIDSTPPAAIPLPAAVWLFSTGLLSLASIARRKKA